MGKFSGSKSNKPFEKRPPPPKELPSSDEEEEDDEEMDEESGMSDFSQEAPQDYGAFFADSVKVLKEYLKDPLAGFFSNPDHACTAEDANRIYAARAIVAREVDPVLSASSNFAKEYRAMEIAHLRELNEKLFVPRREAALKEIKQLKAAELADEGHGLMWSSVLEIVCDKLSQRFPTHVIEFTDQDTAIFNHCVNIVPSYVDNDPFKGIAFDFEFHANPFFTNTTLRCEFHYATAQLVFDRVGVNASAIVGVVCPTSIDWKSGQAMEETPEEEITADQRSGMKQMLEAFLPSSAGFSAAETEHIKRLMLLWPRSFFNSLFGTSTPLPLVGKFRGLLVDGSDESPDGVIAYRAGSFELHPWKLLSSLLMTGVKAPMMAIMDAEEAEGEFMGDDEEEEEEGDEESDDDDDDDDEDGDGKPQQAKKNRKEGAPPPDCKQQ